MTQVKIHPLRSHPPLGCAAWWDRNCLAAAGYSGDIRLYLLLRALLVVASPPPPPGTDVGPRCPGG